MSKPNFNTNLHFGKALDLLNELNEHKIEASFSAGEVDYFICGINDRTKNLLCNLGVNINELPEGFYQEDEGYFDITPIWSEVAYHYGHDVYYDGKKFIVRHRELEKLTDAAIDVLEWIGEIQIKLIQKGIDLEDGQVMKNKLREGLKEVQGDEDEC